MGALDEQQQNEALSQQLEASAVSLPPEDTTNISQLIELDLLADKDKKKTDDESEEEVRQRAVRFSFDLIIRGI